MADIRQPPETALLDAHAQRQRLTLHTSMPGTVVSYDRDAQTCSVQPVICLDDYEENEPPDIMQDVPVQWPGGGGLHMTFPLREGDCVYLHFAEDDFSLWRENCGVNPPVISRRHGMHAIAVPVCRPRSAAIVGTSATEIVIGADDGTGAQIQIDPAGMSVGGTSAVALAPKVLAALQGLATGVTPSGTETGLVTFLTNLLALLESDLSSATLKA